MVNERGVATAVQPQEEGFPVPADLLAQGKTLQRAGTPFVTAISVQKPRNLDKIVEAMDREAEYAGDSFWYSWTDKKGNRIEGPSIGLANSLAREWTNCGVTVDLQETDEAFILTPRFIDIEKGFQCERVFRQRKNVVQGNFDPDRKLDMALQIGQSKAIRNVVVNAVPRWLVERTIEAAKTAVAKKIDPKKLDEHKANCLAFFKKHNITAEQLVAKAGKPMAEWTTRDIADFQADGKALQSGEVSVADLFPVAEVKAPEGPIKMIDLPPIGGAAPKAGPERSDADDSMTDEEKRQAVEREQRESAVKPAPAPTTKTPPAAPAKGGKGIFDR